jgi:tetratricopeptide (TPR) repeat protein
MPSATLPAAAHADARALAQRAGDAEGLGHWDAAAKLYALAFRASVLDHDLPSAADALRGQARVRNHQRRFDEAEELASLSLEIAERHGLHQCAARALNVLGIILHSRGEWEKARAIFPRALEMALDLGDDDLAGLASQNAGVIANALGEFREARALFLEAIGSFVRSGNSAHAMLAYSNLGLVSADLREWMDAEVYFSRGIEIGERLSHSPLLAKLYCNRAEPLIQVGELARARATLDRAEQAAGAVGDRATLAETWRYRAMISALEGNVEVAEDQLRQAASIADDPSLTLERGRAIRQLGILRAEQGRTGEAHQLFARARDLFRSLGADVLAREVDERKVRLGG